MGPRIFISIASYLDPMLFFTLRDAVAKAKYPMCLSFGVVDQHRFDQREKIEALPFASQVRYVHVRLEDTLGVSWARSIAFSLYDGEDFLLQIDSHTLFEQGWDETLMNQYWALKGKSAKHILTTYPRPFEMVGGEPHFISDGVNTILVLRPHPETPLTEENLVLRFRAHHLFASEAVEGCHVAGGFIFTEGNFINEVPYDPFLYFHGEEQSLAIRAYTRGWNIYHPFDVPLRHLYKREGTAYDSHHWHGDIDRRRAFSYGHLQDRAKRRLMQLLTGDPSLGAYGLGHVRTLEEFTALSGIDYRAREIRDVFEGRLK